MKLKEPIGLLNSLGYILSLRIHFKMPRSFVMQTSWRERQEMTISQAPPFTRVSRPASSVIIGKG